METPDAQEARAAPDWDPAQYARYADHRTRPLRDLLARVPDPPPGRADAPRVADLGCGPGAPTALLAERWPAAHITGYDSSPAMLARAAAYAGPTAGGGTLGFVHADLADWRPVQPHDVLFSNAALQWWPGHPEALPAYVDALVPGGTLAFQVPGNFDAPSHVLLHELRNTPRWRDRLGAPARTDAVLQPAAYAAALAPLGCDVDAWETTYVQILHGEDAVLEWTKGTALRPVLGRLADDPQAYDAFLAEYAAALRAAYPPTPHGTLFPFRRVFVVAVRR
ncbi:trans-aconitate 2-methyltransferase [Streptomyces sp. RKND-216]|uniref:trans-aconitate 2-methyltransferase n=1 Tax=Streptomyces sp. RKND-216 TaxID=2562581 RepID=UPI00109DCF2B|nr:trans-aconitate 2-methyltransferase [Streptomyces sp. RKND-216]THA26031.1 trans-aconitate 2-methyltransferase [Streptomyces sp. RKND-216]